MNPIQKLWLQVLSPVANVINNKMAKRSGLLGKIGRFFIIGPREYGMHPFNKMFICLNRRIMFGSAFLLHRYSFVKSLTHNGFHMIRIFRHITVVGPLTVFFGLLKYMFYTPENRGYYPDRLPYIARKIGGDIALPLNSLNQRTSAHYIEINHIYGAEMIKKYHKVHEQIIAERNSCSEKERKTRYADPSYQYVETKPLLIPDKDSFPIQMLS